LKAGDICRNADQERTLKKRVEAEHENARKGRREALRAARNRFYKGDIVREMAQYFEEDGGLFRMKTLPSTPLQ